MKPVLVFVYGTLKHGYGNHHILAGSRFVGKGCTVAMCRMYDAGFPVLRPRSEKPGAHNAEVWGEVYLVTSPDTMRRLDSLEGEGRMYHRRIKIIHLENGKKVKAHTYVGDTKFWRERGCPLWPVQNGHSRPCYDWHRYSRPCYDWHRWSTQS